MHISRQKSITSRSIKKTGALIVMIIPFWEIYISNLGARPVLVRFLAYMYSMYVSDLDNSVTTVHILNSYRTLRSARLTYMGK
jgi:hypothetical protein